jgi:hypothetical protein
MWYAVSFRQDTLSGEVNPVGIIDGPFEKIEEARKVAKVNESQYHWGDDWNYQCEARWASSYDNAQQFVFES